MCGIAGLVAFAPEGVPRCALSATAIDAAMVAMAGGIRHRGPDGEGSWRLPVESPDRAQVALGHSRLAILDLSPSGAQPMVDPATGNAITFNGEIYNFRALRAELERLSDQPWQSQCDTEVILRAYAAWGPACVERFRGMFAFALWDRSAQRLFLARDRLGIKPLYYFAGEGFFLFASELRALLATGLVPRRLDPLGLWHFLTYQTVPAPLTIVQGVRMGLPGAWLRVGQRGELEERRYWDLLANAAPEACSATREESRRRTRELLQEAIGYHLVSDVPVGTFLSGGIDSSAIVTLAAEASVRPVTFTVGFPGEPYDEARLARELARRYGAEHHEIRLSDSDVLSQLPEALGAMDHPTGDGVNTYVVARAVHGAGMKVALSGLGGDELFAGYPSFARLERLAPFVQAWGALPAAVRGPAGWAVRRLGPRTVRTDKAAAMAATDGRIESLYPLTRQLFLAPQLRRLLADEWQPAPDTRDHYADLLAAELSANGRLDLQTQVSFAEARTYMHDLLLRDTDQMSMAHPLEVRVPLLDHPLVEYVMGLPAELKRPDGLQKRLLVESLGDRLPRPVVDLPKRGFSLPFDSWMRGPLHAFCEERLAAGRIQNRGVLSPAAVTGLWQSFLAGRRDVTWSRLWTLVALEEWLTGNGF